MDLTSRVILIKDFLSRGFHAKTTQDYCIQGKRKVEQIKCMHSGFFAPVKQDDNQIWSSSQDKLNISIRQEKGKDQEGNKLKKQLDIKFEQILNCILTNQTKMDLIQGLKNLELKTRFHTQKITN